MEKWLPPSPNSFKINFDTTSYILETIFQLMPQFVETINEAKLNYSHDFSNCLSMPTILVKPWLLLS
jgi:hypothetical protein